ncbi:hypothetical protein SeMB42_g07487 [Synchytrium endobioticum]|uniref:K Homology domain-containing protein n=1 Tax=Synchytrium endobioticum TaxID=286115 RepID=A0A507CHY4_9FUNG|nr:hypothetical protein SeMB42_g07487 [Synchytrium endobioticum]TPX39098.1 hypothetical protein SeLEV6574_g07428 [Synchytrium endobioticum]
MSAENMEYVQVGRKIASSLVHRIHYRHEFRKVERATNTSITFDVKNCRVAIEGSTEADRKQAVSGVLEALLRPPPSHINGGTKSGKKMYEPSLNEALIVVPEVIKDLAITKGALRDKLRAIENKTNTVIEFLADERMLLINGQIHELVEAGTSMIVEILYQECDPQARSTADSQLPEPSLQKVNLSIGRATHTLTSSVPTSKLAGQGLPSLVPSSPPLSCNDTSTSYVQKANVDQKRNVKNLEDPIASCLNMSSKSAKSSGIQELRKLAHTTKAVTKHSNSTTSAASAKEGNGNAVPVTAAAVKDYKKNEVHRDDDFRNGNSKIPTSFAPAVSSALTSSQLFTQSSGTTSSSTTASTAPDTVKPEIKKACIFSRFSLTADLDEDQELLVRKAIRKVKADFRELKLIYNRAKNGVLVAGVSMDMVEECLKSLRDLEHEIMIIKSSSGSVEV